MVTPFEASSLNEEQREAVLHESGPLMVFAGAGSGKTRVITCRVARLISESVDPRRILAVTFTNKSADEMRGRVESMVGEQTARLWMGTFHSVCARLLRIDGRAIGVDARFVIYDDADQVSTRSLPIRSLGRGSRAILISSNSCHFFEIPVAAYRR